MATVPTVPAFVAGDSSITKLAQLSQAVSFLSNVGVRPAWHFYRTTTFALASGWNTPGYTNVAFDSDGVQSSGSAVIQTQGYYACEGCTDIFTSANTAFTVDTRFLITAGPSNPHLAPGGTRVFGQRGGKGFPFAHNDTAVTCSDVTPFCLYPGDKIDLQTFVDIATATLNPNVNGNSVSGRFVANFTGYYLRTGT